MGQKVNPIIYRLSSNKHWRSPNFLTNSNSLSMDFKIRAYLTNLLSALKINYDNILIKRYPNTRKLYVSITVDIKSNNIKPIIIRHLRALTGFKLVKIDLTVANSFNTVPVYNANLLSRYIIKLIESRSRAGMKKLILMLKEIDNLKGYKIRLGGRINGVEMARHNIFKRGSLPLQTINSPVDYAYNTANTKYGIIGVKVWLLYQ